MHNGRRKEVTGVVVNTKASVRRKDLRRFRALLHQIEKNGTEGKYWNREKYLAAQKKYDASNKKGTFNYDVLTEMMGFAAYVKVVDSDKGHQMIHSVKELMDKYLRFRLSMCKEELDQTEIDNIKYYFESK